MATMAVGAGLEAGGAMINAAMSRPSAAALAINSQIQDVSSFMASQAKTEGLDASTVFNNLMTPMQRIVQAGPNQAGWSNQQFADWNSSATQSAAAAARDMGGVGTGAGGPGQSASQVMAARQKAEDQRSSTIAAGQQMSYKQGAENFKDAAAAETKLPSVFGTANQGADISADVSAGAAKSQASIDAAKKAGSFGGILSAGMEGAGGALMGAGGGAGGAGGAGGGLAKGLQGFMKGSGGSSPQNTTATAGEGGDIAGAVPNADMFS